MASLVDLWLDALTGFYSLCRGERAAELRRESFRRYDSRGVHPPSEEVGRVSALQALEPVLLNAGFDPVLVRNAARDDADDAWLTDRAFAVRLLVDAAADRAQSAASAQSPDSEATR